MAATVRYYRRPLSAMIEVLTNAGLAVERLMEPLPTDEFRTVKPDSYKRLLRRPEFLIIRARPWHTEVSDAPLAAERQGVRRLNST